MAVPFSDLQSVAPSAVIELFQLELNTAQHGVNETYYFHAGVNATNSADIIWNGQAYLAFPIEATDFEYTGTGSLPRPKLRISNIFGTITALMLSLPSGLEGAKVTRIRTLARYIDGVNFPGGTNPLGTPDPTAEFPREIYYIDRKAAENRDLIEFELASAFDLVGVRAPKRQCVSNVCQWTYRGPECGYAGNAYFNFNDQPVAAVGQDVCGKRLSSCEARFEQQRRTGSVIVGSNILTLTQASSFSTGDPVTGFGLPTGTTVVSVAGSAITVSNNALGSTSVVTTGTIQTNYTQIVVASATGIIPGMTVTGSFLPANCQVVAVSGTTITLSSTVNLTQFFSVVGSANSQVTVDQSIFFPKNTALSVGWYVGSSVMPLSRLAQITGLRNRTVKTTAGKNIQVSEYRIADITQNQGSNKDAAWTFYVFAGISSAAYTFAATDQTYTFRADGALPYGSYPGIGSFAT